MPCITFVSFVLSSLKNISIVGHTSSTTLISENNITIYPNHTTGIIFVNGENISKIEVFNTIGGLVKTETSKGLVKNMISLSEHEKGIYLIKHTPITATKFRE